MSAPPIEPRLLKPFWAIQGPLTLAYAPRRQMFQEIIEKREIDRSGRVGYSQ